MTERVWKRFWNKRLGTAHACLVSSRSEGLAGGAAIRVVSTQPSVSPLVCFLCGWSVGAGLLGGCGGRAIGWSGGMVCHHSSVVYQLDNGGCGL